MARDSFGSVWVWGCSQATAPRLQTRNDGVIASARWRRWEAPRQHRVHQATGEPLLVVDGETMTARRENCDTPQDRNSPPSGANVSSREAAMVKRAVVRTRALFEAGNGRLYGIVQTPTTRSTMTEHRRNTSLKMGPRYVSSLMS